MKKLFLILAVAMTMFACSEKNERENPFFAEWDTPEGVPPFESILNSDYKPAFEEGFKQQNAEVDQIVNNSEEPTFENTLAALDGSGELLDKVCGVFFNVCESDGNDSLDALQEEIRPMLSEHQDNIFMNAKLFERVDAVYKNRENQNYDSEQLRLIEEIHRTFVRNGVALPADKQARIRQINKELAVLETRFGNNLRNDLNGFKLVIEDENDLAGLPEGVREAAAAAARADGNNGKWQFGLAVPSYGPFMKYCENRELRRQMYEAYHNKGNNNNDNDNKQICIDIIRLRIEKAKLLGYNTPAEMILDDTMAKTPEAVNSFLAEIFKAANEKAKIELGEMQVIADRDSVTIEAYDWDFYAEKLRQEKYALDENEIRPYFKMENVRQGVFDVASRLYGVNFEKINDAPLFNPEAECFRVTDNNGALVGVFYCDYFPRASKRGGAWMENIRGQYWKNGMEVRPVVVNIGNFTRPTETTPSLLNVDEVETMFHEFGHALHGLLAKSRYKTLSGTNVARDFVELPSQINENWAFKPEVLAMYAKHYKTGEIIPDSLVQKILATSTFNQGFMTTELCAASILDMCWHNLSSVDGITDVYAFENEQMNAIGLIPQISARYRTTYFNHIWGGGYAAGYYSYLWAEVLDKDAFAVFERNGIFDPATAAAFKVLLSSGNTVDPMQLFRNFKGGDPDIEPMLRGRGLK
ncbi:MAG: M3 family metallopeptidase [bacterium]|nr:M3 family metallopeptidase [Candidatus Minthenecus merdequi]